MSSTNASQENNMTPLLAAAKSLGMDFNSDSKHRPDGAKLLDSISLEWLQLAQFVADGVITDVSFTSETKRNKIHQLYFTFGPDLKFTRLRTFEHSGYTRRCQLYRAVLKDVKDLIQFQSDHPKIIQWFRHFRDMDYVRDIQIKTTNDGATSISSSVRYSDGSWKSRHFGYHRNEEIGMGSSFDIIFYLKDLVTAYTCSAPAPAHAPSFSRILKLEPDPRPGISTTHLVFQKTDDDEIGLYKIHNYDHKTMIVRDGCIYARQGSEVNLNLDAIYVASARSMDPGDWYRVGFELGENFDRKCTYIIVSNPRYEESHQAALRLFNILVAHLA